MNLKLPESLRTLQSSPKTVLFTGVSVLVLVLFLSSTLSQLQLGQGEETGLVALFQNTFTREGYTPWNSGLDEGDSRVPSWILALFWGSIVICLLYAVISPAYRKALIATTLAMVLLAYVLMRIQENQAEREVEAVAGPPQAGDLGEAMALPPPPEPAPWVNDPPPWISIVMGVGGTLVIGWAGYTLWQRYQAMGSPQQQIVQQATDAIQQLDAGQDIADIISHCYVSMVQTMEQHQRIRRSDAMTPREFETHLRKAGLHSHHVHQLSQLFERVRFGDKPAGERDRQYARDCLAQIVEAWGKPV